MTYTPLSYIPTNPFNTQKPLSLINVFPVTHNGLVILHMSDMVDLPGPVWNYGIPNYFGLSFPSTNPHQYIILISPQHIAW